MPTQEEKRKAVERILSQNILVRPEMLSKIENEAVIKKVLGLPEKFSEEDLKQIFFSAPGRLEIVRSYKEEARKRTAEDFTAHFNARYGKLKEILQKKQELQDAMSIKRVASKSEREKVCIIGMIYEKSLTKNKNIMFTLEDPTGQINVVVSKNKPDVFKMAEDCVRDEVIGLAGVSGKNIIFADSIVYPEIPATNELKKGPAEEYAVFTGDQHIGSRHFLHESFGNFIKWINQELGSDEQREIAKKVKYVFLVGDLVDGIGIYPTQYNDLEIKDIEDQYSKLIEAIKQIPNHISIIICAGNHDALRLIEPQPPLYSDYAKGLFEMPNVYMVSNPAVVNMGASENFKGFNVLLYHGASFHFYSENVESIRAQGGVKRADLIMKFLLQRRHLAPEHTSATYVPIPDSDPLLIDIVPDFFVTGHIHRSMVSSYRNITMLNCSCWIGMTDFQEKVGLIPEPARAIAVNLQTRETKVMRF